MKHALRVLFVLALATGAQAQDVVHMKDGSTRNVKVTALEGDTLRISSPVAGVGVATTTVKRDAVERVVFGPDPALEALEQNITASFAAQARVRWQSLEPYLDLPESRAGQAGCVLGETLLLLPETPRHEEALALFQRIETQAWSPADRERAKRGRLAAMLKLGRLEEASREAEEIAATAEDPALLLETKLLLAKARLATLRQLLEDNPRWDQDPPVRAERSKLVNEAADLALFPFLFHGTSRPQAARGLALMMELYGLTGDEKAAREVATDLVEIYPETPEAKNAAGTLPKTTDPS